MTEVRVEGLDELTDALLNVPQLYRRFAVANFRQLGGRIIYFCRQELRDVKYTGALEESFTAEVDATQPSVAVYPTARHSIFVRDGTRPHWAPSGPIRRWVIAKLGDEKATWPVLRSIATHGTSVYQLGKRGTKANPWPARVIVRGDFAVALEATGQRVGAELAGAIAI